MERLLFTRRQMLKVAGVATGLAAAGMVLGPLDFLADDEPEEGLGPFGPWSPPVRIDELASGAMDYHPAISREGLSLYFTTTRYAPTFKVAIAVVRRPHRKAAWDLRTLTPVDNVNALGGNTAAPNLTPDGLRMYFQSNRLGHGGDLYVSSRRHSDDPWEPPVLVPGQLNTPTASESAATYFRDHATGIVRLYFSRFFGIGGVGDANQDFNIYVSVQDEDGAFGEGTIVPSLNSVPLPGDPPGTWSRDTRTAIRRDGLEMFITSNRHGGLSYSGGPIENLWVATRADTSTEDWDLPTLVPSVNSGFGDGGPALSWDARTLYFFSARTASGGPGNWQLWMSTREELGD